MKYYNILFGLLCIFGLVSFSFATNFNSCQTFGTSDTYDLTANIQSNVTCLTVAVAIPTGPTVIDCHGYTIQGGYNNSTTGISMVLSDNVTIRNCIIKDFGLNLGVASGNNLLFENNTFDNSSFTNIQLCTTTMCNNLTLINSTISNGFNNGAEIYGLNNSFILNNTCFGHEHGHGTDRCFHFDRSIYNTEMAYNYMYNNTLGIRSNNVNISNLNIHHNICLNVTAQCLNMQASTGTFENFTYSYNNMSGASGSQGFDATLMASSTKQSDCAQINMTNNFVTGGPLIYLNALNSSSVLYDQSVGGMLLCDSDNVQIYNTVLTGGEGGRNAFEFMHVNNLTLNNFTATNIYTALRGLIVNDSVFSNISISGGIIGSINFAGGTSSRNNISNCSITNINQSVNAAISLGGVGNYVSDCFIYDSSTLGSSMTFQSATTTVNNTYDRITVINMTRGVTVTNIGDGNIIKNSQFKNVPQVYAMNSTASGTKTITLENLTMINSDETLFTTFDLYENASASEVHILNLPASILPFPNASYVDLQSYINITALGSVNGSIEQLNMTIAEIPIEFSRLTWWSANNSAWVEQSVANDGAGKLTFTGVKAYVNENITHGVFYYDMCPVVNQPGYITQLQDYTGSPNPTTGADFACVVINVSNVEFDCQHPGTGNNGFTSNQSNPNSAGFYITPFLTNVTLRNCNEFNYSFGVYSTNSHNIGLYSNTLRNNTDTGAFLAGTYDLNIHQNTFDFNNYALALQAVQNGFVYQNNFFNSTAFGISLGSSTSNVSFDSNILDTNNIDFSMLSVSQIFIYNNNLTNSAFQSVQLINTNSIAFINNLFNIGGDAIYSSSNSNMYLSNNTFANFNNAIYLESGSDNYLESNTITNTSNYGIYIFNDNRSSGINNFFSNNLYSYYVDNSTTTRSISLNASIFDSDGSLTNYSNVTISDTALSSEAYWLNWSSQPDYAATGNLSYRNSSIEFNPVTPSTISSIIFNYFDAGLNSTNELTMRIFRYNGSWSTTGSTVDTTNNRVTLLGFGSSGILSLLYDTSFPVLITSTTINYYSQIPYTSYSVANGLISTLDTGLFNVNYVSSGISGIEIEPIIVFISLVPLVAIALLMIYVKRYFGRDGI